MATSGKPLDERKIAQIRRLRRSGFTIRQIAKVTGVAKATVEKYIAHDVGAPNREEISAKTL